MEDLEAVPDYRENILEKDEINSQEFLYLGKVRHYAEQTDLEDLQSEIEDRMAEYLEETTTEELSGLPDSLDNHSVDYFDDVVTDLESRIAYASEMAFGDSREEAEQMARELAGSHLNGLIREEALEFEGESIIPKELALE